MTGRTARGVWILVAVIALVLSAGAGALVAGLEPDRVAAAEPTIEPGPDAGPDLDAISNTATALVGGLTAQLPVPEAVPADAYAPTPEVRHGMLELPSIGVSQPLYEGVTLTAINRGPSHWPGTAMPGQLGNVVVAGHRTTYTRPFWDLDLLQPGDPLVFTMADGSRHVYVLDRTEVVDDSAMWVVDQTFGFRATLFACHPKGSARQRIVGHFTLQSSAPAG